MRLSTTESVDFCVQSCGHRSVNNTRAELWRPERKALNAAKVINDYGVCVKTVHIDFQAPRGGGAQIKLR